MKTIKPQHVVLVVALWAAQTASAAIITVTSTNDSGAGTLRQAIADAVAGDTINFTVTGTITLTSGELVIDKNLSITGPGPTDLAVDGNAASRVFHVSSNLVVTIDGLTITNGFRPNAGFPDNAGGGILNDRSSLLVSNCTLSGNSAGYGGGGIYNNGWLAAYWRR